MKTKKILIVMAGILFSGLFFHSCQKEQSITPVREQSSLELKYSDSWFSIENEICFGDLASFCFTYSGTRTTQIQKETTPGVWVQLYQKPNSIQYCDYVDLGVTGPGSYKLRYNVSGPGGPQIIFYITVHALPTAVLTGDATICDGECATLSVELTGVAPWAISYTDGETEYTLTGIQTSPYSFEVCPATTTTYSLTEVDDAHCTGESTTGTATVNVENCECENWQTQTAFGGSAAGAGNSWWFYYDGVGSEPIWAGQTINAGSVLYENGHMVISLANGWELDPVKMENGVEVENLEPVKIQGYNVLPASRPPAGQFTTYKGAGLDPAVGVFSYYIVHLDVRKCMDN